MAIAVSGVILSGLATGFIATLRGTTSAHERLVDSNGAHTLSTYLTADLESANPDLTSTVDTATLGCNSSPPAGTTNVLRLQWSERPTASELRVFSVSYRILGLNTDADPQDDEWRLVRYACSRSQDPAVDTMATILSNATPLTEHVMVSALHEPVAPYLTKAEILPATPKVVSLTAFAAPVKGESTPYSYTFSGNMRMPKPVPRVVSITRNGLTTTSGATVAWTVTFSEAVFVAGVDPTDFELAASGLITGASIVSATAVNPTGAPPNATTFTVTANTGTGQGTLALTVDDDDTIRSSTDNDPLGDTGADNGDVTGGGYNFDNVGPMVVVEEILAAESVSTVPITDAFRATFNEPVSDFDDAADVVNNAGVGGAPGAVFSIAPDGPSGKTYLITVSALGGSGTIRPRVVANAAKDAAGNNNALSTDATDNEIIYSTAAPVLTITNVELTNGSGGGSQVGRLEKGDQVVVTFSDSMDVDTFCSTWTGTTPSITTANVVRVTVTDGGAGNDILTVSTTSGCTFNFGSLNLGSAGWVTTTTNFEGSGGNKSEIAYDDTTRKLTITLGGGTNGPSGLAASTPTYDASDALRSSTGGSIANDPFTPATASRF
jgi:hypothetical protein